MVIHHLFHNVMSVQVTTCLQEHFGVVGLCICVSVLREGDLCCLLCASFHEGHNTVVLIKPLQLLCDENGPTEYTVRMDSMVQ